MISFKTFLSEEKNLHMTHLEDSILIGGIEGAKQALNFARSLRNMLAGNASNGLSLTTKWDGAPAIFAGVDPEDGQFFVAKKSLFAKNPKTYKTDADVDKDISSGDLATKMKLALKYLKPLGIKNVIQGDFLYANEDLRKEEIDGTKYISFHPNTIVYAIPTDSDLAKKIKASKIGIVWHTVYRGNSISDMKASFGEDIASKLKENKAVWSVDAKFQDLSGKATFTKKETDVITQMLWDARKYLRKVDGKVISAIVAETKLVTRINKYMNDKIRAGMSRTSSSTDKDAKAIIDYVEEWYMAEIDKRKSDRGKEKQRVEMEKMLKLLDKTNMKHILDFYAVMVSVKKMILQKLNSVEGMRAFLKKENGFDVTNQEGFVAIDHIRGNALKLVDRMEFSRANFSPEFIKGWQK